MNGHGTSLLLVSLVLPAACGGASTPAATPASTPAPTAEASAPGRIASNSPAPLAEPNPSSTASCDNGGKQPSSQEIADALKPLNGTFEYEGAFPIVSKLATRYPASVYMLKTLGKLELTKAGSSDHTKLAGEASAHARRAVDFLKRALALHDRGCAFTDADTSATMGSLATAYVASGDYAASVAEWKALIAKWPTDAAPRVAYAEELCENGDEPGCADAFQNALDVALAKQGPAFSDMSIEAVVSSSRAPASFVAIKNSGKYAKIIHQEEVKTGKSFPQQQQMDPDDAREVANCQDSCIREEHDCQAKCSVNPGWEGKEYCDAYAHPDPVSSCNSCCESTRLRCIGKVNTVLKQGKIPSCKP